MYMETIDMKVCKVCGSEIPAGRVKALPNTTTCVEHSKAEKFAAAVISYGNPEDDVFQEIEILRNERDKKAYRAYRDSLGTYK